MKMLLAILALNFSVNAFAVELNKCKISLEDRQPELISKLAKANIEITGPLYAHVYVEEIRNLRSTFFITNVKIEDLYYRHSDAKISLIGPESIEINKKFKMIKEACLSAPHTTSRLYKMPVSITNKKFHLALTPQEQIESNFDRKIMNQIIMGRAKDFCKREGFNKVSSVSTFIPSLKELNSTENNVTISNLYNSEYFGSRYVKVLALENIKCSL